MHRAETDETDVWVAGEDGLATYYVYGLARTNRDTLLAFSEGRIERCDACPHHIVLKRSADGGRTWGQNQFLVVSEDGACFCNPTPIVERETGRVFLFFARNFDNATTELYYLVSENDGLSWSAPTAVTALFAQNPHGWTFHLPGPGHGIQLNDGRLLVQVWHRRPISLPTAERRYGVSVLYSDDAGATWQAGGTVQPDGKQMNESRIVQLASGELLMNARSGPFVSSRRVLSYSRDRGATWAAAEYDLSLPASYATDSGLISMTNKAGDGAHYLVFSRPLDLHQRTNLTVSVSDDDGRSWARSRTIYRGVVHYSDLVGLPDGSVGAIYGKDSLERDGGIEGNISRVSFAHCDYQWITGQA